MLLKNKIGLIMLVTMGLMQGSLFEKGSEEGSKETSVDFV